MQLQPPAWRPTLPSGRRRRRSFSVDAERGTGAAPIPSTSRSAARRLVDSCLLRLQLLNNGVESVHRFFFSPNRQLPEEKHNAAPEALPITVGHGAGSHQLS